MNTRSLLLAAVLTVATSGAAVVAPPDGKDNALATPVAPQSTATQVPPPKDPQPGGASAADPAAPLPTDPIAPDPAPNAPEKREFNNEPLVRVDVLMISVPEQKALPLIRQLRDSAQFAAAEMALLEMVVRKEANLEGWPEITTHSQMRAVTESIVEQRYPIEFDVQGPAAVPPDPPAVPKPGAAKPSARPIDEPVAQAQNTSGVIPTTFETRNTGATLEAEPIVSPDRTAITISLSPQLVRFERFTEFSAGTSPKGDKQTVSQPIFATSKVTTTLSLRDGERRLIHVGKATEDHSRIDLFILGVKIQASPAGPQ